MFPVTTTAIQRLPKATQLSAKERTPIDVFHK